MQQQASAWWRAARKNNRVLNAKIHKFLIYTLLAPLLVSIISPIQPAYAAPTLGTGDGLFVSYQTISGTSSAANTYQLEMQPKDFCNQTIATSIDFTWTSTNRPGASCGTVSGSAITGFSALFTGYILAPVTGSVTFKTRVDDSFYLQINGTQVISDISDKAAATAPNYNSTGSFSMVEGRIYPIRFWYHQNASYSSLSLFWNYNGTDELVPQSNLGTSALALGTNCTIGTEFCPANSAYQIKQVTGTNSNGVYWVNVAGVSTQVYAIMDNNVDGGGWTIAMKGVSNVKADNNGFAYGAASWTDLTTTNPTSPSPLLNLGGQTCASASNFSCATASDANAKYNTFNYTRAGQIMAIFPDVTSKNGGAIPGLTSNYGFNWKETLSGFASGTSCPTKAATLQNIFASASKCQWRTPSGSYSSSESPYSMTGDYVFSTQGGYRFFGLNYANGSRSSRFGFGWNNEADQGSNDVSGGIGINAGSYQAGDLISCCQWYTGLNRKMGFEIYVRNPITISSKYFSTAAGTASTFSPTYTASTGGAMLTYSLDPFASGQSLSGFSINSSTGAISITSSVPSGDYKVVVNATDTNGETVNFVVALRIGTVPTTSDTDSSGVFSNNSSGTNPSFLQSNERPIPTGAAAFTVETWLYLNSLNSKYQIAISQGGGGYSGFALGVTFDGFIRVGNNWKSGTYGVTSYKLPVNQWVHVAVTKDSTNTGQLFVNSVKVDQSDTGGYFLDAPATNIALSPGSTLSQFRIGAQYDQTAGNPYAEYWNGKIDEIKIWDSVRTSSQIFDGLNAFQSPSTSGLLAYYSFNRISSGKVIDEVSNNDPDADLVPANISGAIAPTFVALESVTQSNGSTLLSFPRSYLTASGGYVLPVNSTSVSAFLVGGGGGGGADGGAGGGGGSINTVSSLGISANRVVTIKVGLGGPGGLYAGTVLTTTGTAGVTTFLTSNAVTYSAPGGAGGGGCSASSATNGGALGSNGSPVIGGKGGAGANGNCTNVAGSNGSAGPTSEFTGTLTNYGGGGGGGPYPNTSTIWGPASGGAGGGGNGASGSNTALGIPSTAGIPGTGGGGGGGRAGDYNPGSGNTNGRTSGSYGGSGIVYLKVASSISGTAATVTTLGSQVYSDTYTVASGFDKASSSFTMSPTIPGITLETLTSPSSSSYIAVRLNVSSTLAAQTYYETITARDSTGAFVTKALNITVAAPLQWDSANSNSLTTTAGKTTSIRLNIVGGSGTRVVRMVHTSTTQPRGLSIDTSTANSGAPSAGYVTVSTDTGTAQGSYVESITVVDSTRITRTFLLTINVNAPPDITYSPSTDAAYPYVTNDLGVNLDTGNPNSYSGSGTTWLNQGSWGGNYPLYGTPTFSENSGGILNFGTNKYSDSTQTYSTAITNFTVESWFRLNSLNSNTYPCIVCSSYLSSRINFALYLDGTAGKLTGSYHDGTNAWQAKVFVPTNLVKNTWYHAAYSVKFNASTSKYDATLYLNGISVATSSSSLSPTVGANSKIIIGKRWDTAEYIDGSIPIVRIYTQALSGTQVLQNYQNTKVRFLSATSVAPTNSGQLNLNVTDGTGGNFSVFTGTAGTGNKAFTLSGSNSKITLDTGTTNSAILKIDPTISATSAIASKNYYETITAVDSTGIATAYYITVTVNPKVSLVTSTGSDTITTTFGVSKSLIINSSYGSGSTTITRTSSSSSSYISLSTTSVTGGTSSTLTVANGLAAGTYYETITATDSANSTTTKVISIVVVPSITLTSDSGVNALETTYQVATTLRINATNGVGNRTYSLALVGQSSAGITIDTSTASSNYVTLKVSNSVAVNTYTARIRATDSNSVTTQLDIAVTVNGAVLINSSNSSSANFVLTQGTALTTSSFAATLGTGVKTFTLSPTISGISLDTSVVNAASVLFANSLTATNSTTSKTISETLTATDSMGATAKVNISLFVNPPIIETATTTTITTSSGVESSTVIYATQGTGNKTFTLSGTATSGVTLTSGVNQATLKVLSTINPGTYWETVTATDTAGATTDLAIKVIVNPGISIFGPSTGSMTVGYSYISPTYLIANGVGLISSTIAGSLNSGISIETVTATSIRYKVTSSVSTGTYFETITATDAIGAIARIPITLTVNPVLSFTSNDSTTTTFGTAKTVVLSTSSGTGQFNILGTSICAPYVTYDGAYTVASFVATGSCTWTAPKGVTSVSSLVVGGGASGDRGWCSYYWGHGGGGGEVIKTNATSVTAGSNYAITVGAGGLGDSTASCPGTNGKNGGSSSFSSITARGGNGATYNSGTGGTSGNGNSGGTATADLGGGGGGGAGGVGGGINSLGTTSPLNGGVGVNDTITGSTIMYGSGGAGKSNVGFGSAYSGGGAGAAQIPVNNRGGGGSDLITGYSGGGSGIVVLRYLTPAATDTSALLIQTDTYTGTIGKVIVSIPESVTAGSYTETFTVTDLGTSSVSSQFVFKIVVSKATPTATLSLPGGVTTARYGTPVTLTANASTSGTVTFKKGATTLCSTVAVSNGLATCDWTPNAVETATLTAILTPADSTNYNNSVENSSAISIVVSKADSITVTANSPASKTYSDSMTPPTNGYTVSGLASFDSLSSVSYRFDHKADTCANGGACVVGDIGPAGGYIIYVSATPINVASGISTGGTYLEAAPAPYSKSIYNWCEGGANPYTTTINASGSAVGTGADNTRIMVASCTGGAGYVAANLTLGGYSDWFLPSSGELALLSTYKRQIGLDDESLYWGSTESSNWVASSLVTFNGGVGGQNKGQATPLWPIRAFSIGSVVLSGNPATGGNFKITPSAATFSSAGKENNYEGIKYVEGSYTVTRALRGSWTATYNRGTNITTYAPNKTETITVSYSGDGFITYSTTSSVCSVNASSGKITLLGVGTCALQLSLSQTTKWASDTKYVNVTINRGPRNASITSSKPLLKYGETTSVTSSVTLAVDSATTTYSAGSSTGCSVDPSNGEVTATKGALGTCSVSVTYEQTSLYEAATNFVAITLANASSPVVTVDSVTAISYTGAPANFALSYKVSGIVARDIVQIIPTADVSSETSTAFIAASDYTTIAGYKYSGSGTGWSYSETTTAPTDGGTYSIKVYGLALKNSLDLSNYNAITYSVTNGVINPIAQATLKIAISIQESITVPYDVVVEGGSSTGAVSLQVVSGGTASGCAISGLRLTTLTAGSCFLVAKRASDRNYLEVLSETATVSVLNFVQNIVDIFNGASGITINHDVPLTKPSAPCLTDCVPTITSVYDVNSASATTIYVGLPIHIVGTNLNTVTEVFFQRRLSVDASQITIIDDYNIRVNVPTLNTARAVEIYVVASGGESVAYTGFTTITS